jgi:uncharacterized membrane protein YkoI
MEKRKDGPMKAKDLKTAGHASTGIAMVAAVVGALSLTSVPTLAFASDDDRAGDDRGGSSSASDDRGGDSNGATRGDSTSDSNGDDSNDSTSDSNGDDSNDSTSDGNGGDTSDDRGYDDKGGDRAGNGTQTGVPLPALADVAAEWETRGYRVLEISRENATVVEMKVVTPEGQRVEMYVDATDNTILSQRLDG